MARNEEKQLARLNRFYLEKQKQGLQLPAQLKPSETSEMSHRKTDKQRIREYRERIKADPERCADQRRKDVERNKKFRQRQKSEEEMSKLREGSRLRMQKSRDRMKEEKAALVLACGLTPCKPPAPVRRGTSKAVAKVDKAAVAAHRERWRAEKRKEREGWTDDKWELNREKARQYYHKYSKRKAKNRPSKATSAEELKKRPPRPRLDTLNTSRDIRKWLPTITRDIDFYVKQMEVICYTDAKVEEFSDRIQRLKQEYQAYLRKLRTLEPDTNAASWADRPYSHRKRQADDSAAGQGKMTDREEIEDEANDSTVVAVKAPKITPIATPVIQNLADASTLYGFEKPEPVVWNVNPDTQDAPLQFGPPKTLAICGATQAEYGHGRKESCLVCHASHESCDCQSSSKTCTTSKVENESEVVNDLIEGRSKEEPERALIKTFPSGISEHLPSGSERPLEKNTRPPSCAGNKSNSTSVSNLLNLDYSDSSDENS